MTLLEVAIGVTLMVMVTAGALRVAESTAQAISTDTVAADLHGRAQHAVDQIGERLRTTSRGSVTPALPVAAPFTIESRAVTYSPVVGIDQVTQSADWGNPEQIFFERSPLDPNDGIDNDGNGLVDEGRVVLIEDPAGANRRSILATRVAEAAAGEILGNALDDNGNGLVDEAGLSFEIHERGMTIRLTLERVEPGGQTVTATAERSVAFRNSTP